MNNLLKKMSKAWQNYWMDDEYDLDKKHLSQHDKRSLLCGGFMIGFVTFLLFSTGIIIGNAWSNYKSQKEVNQILATFATYMATATEDEYEEIAKTIRHDLVYSDYGTDIENLIQYIPNTADGCCLEREDYPERVNLIFLNTGEAYGLDIFDQSTSVDCQREHGGTIITSGYDEISEAHFLIIKNLNLDSGTASLDRGRGIISAHKMKSRFCDECIRKILTTVKNEKVDEAVIYDTEEKVFYPVKEGDVQIGDYSFHTFYENGDYKFEIEYIEE